MGLMDRWYMRDTARTHVGSFTRPQATPDHRGETRVNEVTYQQRRDAQINARRIARQLKWRRIRKRMYRALIAAALLIAVTAWVLTSGLVAITHSASGLTFSSCTPWPACFRPVPWAQYPAISGVSHTFAGVSHTAAPVDGSGRVEKNPLWGVHICGASDYDPSHLDCFTSVKRFRINHLGLVYLSATGPGGADFSAPDMVTVVRRMRNGRPTNNLGIVTTHVRNGSAGWGILLRTAFVDAKVKPHAGMTYRIVITNGRKLIGVTTFTIIH